MPIVWRLEHECSGVGVYASGAAFAAHHHHERGCDCDGPHPGPMSDNGLRDKWLKLTNDQKWSFGFATLDQYKKWFYGADARKALADYESSDRNGPMVLKKYEVPASAFRRGDKQAVFMKDKARLINSRRPDFCDRKKEAQ